MRELGGKTGGKNFTISHKKRIFQKGRKIHFSRFIQWINRGIEVPEVKDKISDTPANYSLLPRRTVKGKGR